MSQQLTTHPPSLLDELGLGDLPEAERDRVLEEIGEIIFEGVMVKVLDGLPEDKQEALANLFEASSADPESEEKHQAIFSFIAAEVPQYDTYVQEEVALLKATYDKNVSELTTGETEEGSTA